MYHFADDASANPTFYADLRKPLPTTIRYGGLIQMVTNRMMILRKRRKKTLTISEVSLDKLPQVDDVKFQAALKKRGITAGLPLLRYYYSGLEERINDSLAEASSSSINEGTESAWITIRPAGSRKLKVIVSLGYSACRKFGS